jgi:hypothetical protein
LVLRVAVRGGRRHKRALWMARSKPPPPPCRRGGDTCAIKPVEGGGSVGVCRRFGPTE